jgi:hypothetical protein
VAAAEAQHVAEEGAAAGVDALVDGAVEVATAEHGTKEGPDPTDVGVPAGTNEQPTFIGETDEVEARTDQPIKASGGFKPDELESPVYDDGTQPQGPNLQV